MPLPVGPTMQTTSPTRTVSSRTGSALPSLARPPMMVTSRTFSSLVPRKSSIAPMKPPRRATKALSQLAGRSGLDRVWCAMERPSVHSRSSAKSTCSSMKNWVTKG